MRLLFLFLGLTFCSLNLWADPVCVTAPKSVLRDGPGQQFRASWTVGQNMPFMKISQWGNWLQVEDLDGEKHWIAANHVAYGGQCVVVKTKQAVLRQGPGQKFLSTEFGQAEKYMAFKKINREAEWIQVEDDYHMKYWMNEKSLWLPIKTTRLEF